MSRRTDQLAHSIQREVAECIHVLCEGEEFPFITVVRCEVLEDLSLARIYVSSFENGEELVAYLTKRKGYIQKKISPRLSLKKIPALEFRLHDGNFSPPPSLL